MIHNKKKPLISVIVTTYNRKLLLKETIESILAQTFTDFELIVVDNYSDYDFIAYMESFKDSRIRAFQNKNDGIIAVNRNVGIKKARGEYIAFCDDDDLWVKYKLEKQLKCFGNNKIIGVGSNQFKLADSGIQQPTKKYQEDKTLDFETLIMFNNVALSSLIIRNIGFLFEEKKSFIAVEDFDFQLQLTKKSSKSILLLSEPLIYYRFNSVDRSSGIKQVRNVLLVTKKYEPFLSLEAVNQLYHLQYYFLAKRELKELKRKTSRINFRKSLEYRTDKNNKNRKIIAGIILSYQPVFILRFYFKLIRNK